MGRAPKLDDEAILDRAMLAFWRNGWTSTSIRDLERAVGMKAPSLYRRFGNKEGLGVAVVDHYVERIVRRRVERLLPGTGDPLENVTEFLTRSVTESADGPGLWGCLLTTTAVEADRLELGGLEQADEEQHHQRRPRRGQQCGATHARVTPDYEDMPKRPFMSYSGASR